jgi:hypothetical protein
MSKKPKPRPFPKSKPKKPAKPFEFPKHAHIPEK